MLLPGIAAQSRCGSDRDTAAGSRPAVTQSAGSVPTAQSGCEARVEAAGGSHYRGDPPLGSATELRDSSAKATCDAGLLSDLRFACISVCSATASMLCHCLGEVVAASKSPQSEAAFNSAEVCASGSEDATGSGSSESRAHASSAGGHSTDSTSPRQLRWLLGESDLPTFSSVALPMPRSVVRSLLNILAAIQGCPRVLLCALSGLVPAVRYREGAEELLALSLRYHTVALLLDSMQAVLDEHGPGGDEVHHKLVASGADHDDE